MTEPLLESLRAAARAAVADPRGGLGSPVAARLFALSDEAFATGHGAAVDEIVDGLRPQASDAAREILATASLRENDGEFRDHSVQELTIRRVDFAGGGAQLPDLGLEIFGTPAGAVMLRSLDGAERTIIGVATEVQLFVPNDLPDDRAAQLHARGFDLSNLAGSLAAFYELRVIRRALWGMGIVFLTDRRAFGLVFDDEVKGVASSEERMAMPAALVTAADGGSGTILVFSCERSAFDGKEVAEGMLQGKMPYVNLTGSCGLALDTYRVVDPSFVVVKPSKGQIADAVREFAPRRDSDAAGRDAATAQAPAVVQATSQPVVAAVQATPASPAAGWYPDPLGGPQRRYWDGAQWGPYEETAAAVAPAGWYPDPMGGTGQRYWDGSAWGLTHP